MEPKWEKFNKLIQIITIHIESINKSNKNTNLIKSEKSVLLNSIQSSFMVNIMKNNKVKIMDALPKIPNWIRNPKAYHLKYPDLKPFLSVQITDFVLESIILVHHLKNNKININQYISTFYNMVINLKMDWAICGTISKLKLFSNISDGDTNYHIIYFEISNLDNHPSINCFFIQDSRNSNINISEIINNKLKLGYFLVLTNPRCIKRIDHETNSRLINIPFAFVIINERNIQLQTKTSGFGYCSYIPPSKFNIFGVEDKNPSLKHCNAPINRNKSKYCEKHIIKVINNQSIHRPNVQQQQITMGDVINDTGEIVHYVYNENLIISTNGKILRQNPTGNRKNNTLIQQNALKEKSTTLFTEYSQPQLKKMDYKTTINGKDLYTSKSDWRFAKDINPIDISQKLGIDLYNKRKNTIKDLIKSIPAPKLGRINGPSEPLSTCDTIDL